MEFIKKDDEKKIVQVFETLFGAFFNYFSLRLDVYLKILIPLFALSFGITE